uniref:Uncharacterized protein n=1 Tax=Oryza meridionalis TaxID=40149 RepID=A0A0E0FBV8_9ORYZ
MGRESVEGSQSSTQSAEHQTDCAVHKVKDDAKALREILTYYSLRFKMFDTVDFLGGNSNNASIFR